MDSQSVHVVIVNWNGATDTEKCLESLFRLETHPVIVTVIDNSKNHAPCVLLQSQFKNVEFIFCEKNLGFALACNIGWEKSVGLGTDYTLFLNNDTEVVSPFLHDALMFMHHNSNVAAVSPLINYFDSPSMPWFHSSHIDGVTVDIVHAPAQQLDSPHLVPWLSGCAMLIRTELLSDCSGFDGKFFLYSEDVDLSLKLRKMGYDLAIIPTLSILHKVGASTNKLNQISTFYAVRNKLIVVRRYFNINIWSYTYRLVRESYGSVLRSSVSVMVKIKFVFVICSAVIAGFLIRK
jgi:GT2 family glycosyltransferase